ncbi:MAG: Hsp70 family protein, partial [Alphaproteobacteria bacterium]|nr:Hsp70 family protein [Alphaproteobacteria bacterium]
VGIPPAQRGIPQVEVTFDIDANGIVNVSAKDKATNKEQQIRIQAGGGLSEEDIDKMVKEAEVNAEGDREKRDLVETKNQAESLINSIESSIEDLGDDIPADEKGEVESALEELRSVLDGEDIDKIKSKTENLSKISMKLGEMAYRKAQEEANTEVIDSDSSSAPEDDTSSPDDGETIDADFTDLEIEDEKDEKDDKD